MARRKVILYTLASCRFSDMLREELLTGGIDFEERQLDDRPEWQEEVEALTELRRVPVTVWPDGRIEIGYDGALC